MHWFRHFLMYFELFWYKTMLFQNWIWYSLMHSWFSFDGNSISFWNCMLNSILFDGLSIHIRYLISLNTFVDQCMRNSILFNGLSIHIWFVIGLNTFVDRYMLNLIRFDCLSIYIRYLITSVDKCMLNSMLLDCLLICIW